MQSVTVGDKTAGISLAFAYISCVYAYSLLEWSVNSERNTISAVRRNNSSSSFERIVMFDDFSSSFGNG